MDDVLDPSIVCFTPKLGGSLIGGMHEDFPHSRQQGEFEVVMVDMDELEERARFQVVLKDPEDVPEDHELWQQLQQRSPQFFLRNVMRHVMDHHYPHVPWLTEIWRDAQEYAMTFGTDVLTYQRADMSPSDEARRIIQDERANNREVIERLDWHDYHGRWKEGLTPHTWYEQHGLLEQRGKGRFADDPVEKKKEVVSMPAESRFDASQAQERPTPKPTTTAAEIDPRFENLPDEIKKMLGLL
jgi:hypothetical protein